MTTDEQVRRAALTRLAVATKELLPETKESRDAFFRIYLDGLANFSTQSVLAVCARLETTAEGGWFPKLPVLCDHLRAYVRMKQEQQRPARLTEPPVSPEKLKELRAAVAQRIQKMRMR